jgi:tRNA (Thr-GGU) A37 N-methylase
LYIKFLTTLFIYKGIIQYTPIEIFHTDYTPDTGAPRQGILIPETKGTIEIFTPYRGALNTLGLFEYIIVLYHFSEVERWEPEVNPPSSDHEHNFGLFSTRSPKRPNPIDVLHQGAYIQNVSCLFLPFDILYNYSTRIFNSLQSIIYPVRLVQRITSSGKLAAIYIVLGKSSFYFLYYPFPPDFIDTEVKQCGTKNNNHN